MLHKIPYVVIHSGLDVLGSLLLNDSQDVCEINFCKCGSPPLPTLYSPLSSFLVSFRCKGSLNKTHSMCKGQSALSGVLAGEI